MSYEYYPELDDPDFQKKIYKKKEFHKHKFEKTVKTDIELCNPREFQLAPQQKFLKNFISELTPYNGVLIFHGVGIGKTCPAILIAEQFKHRVQQYNKRIIVILGKNIISNFRRNIYDASKEELKKRSSDIVQCTGNEYMLSDEEAKYLTKEQRLRKIDKKINSYYQFLGYEKFANEVLYNTEWDGVSKPSDIIKKRISSYYSNRVIVIDEVQHVKNVSNIKKKVPPILEAVIRYSNNVKLILLSATPMHDRPQEIIYILNLLLLNDKRAMIRESDVFDMHGDMTDTGKTILQKISRNYISYLRGQNPITFPIRLYPESAVIPTKITRDMQDRPLSKDVQIKYLRLIPAYFRSLQESLYKDYIETETEEEGKSKKKKSIKSNEQGQGQGQGQGQEVESEPLTLEEYDEGTSDKSIGLTKSLLWISNIAFPTRDGNGTYGKAGITSMNDGKGGLYTSLKIIDKKRFLQFKYQNHAIFNKDTKTETPFLSEERIADYSVKFAEILKNIKTAKGIVFLYSTYLSAGVIPLALMLEQNGFIRYEIEGERQLLDYTTNQVGGGGKHLPICYLCSKTAASPEHTKTHNNYHQFRSARYIILTGDRNITKLDTDKAIARATEILNSKSNEYGKEVKIIIGNKVVAEGINFKRIRQIHILEPWYNLQTLEQIIGRADRNCSHIDLPPAQRNVEIFLYTGMLRGSTKETIDLHNYRISEIKDIKIKYVERVLKQSAIDCPLNKVQNIYGDAKSKLIKLQTASGRTLLYRVGDHDYSRICDYQKCDYKCDWEPTGKEAEMMKIDTDTYDISFIDADILTINKIIAKIYQFNYIYDIRKIVDIVLAKDPSTELDNIYLALDKLLTQKIPIYDKYGRQGYLIYRGGYYIFQPLEINDEKLPMYYRMRPLTIKTRAIPIDNLPKETKEIVQFNKELFEGDVETYRELLGPVIKSNKISEGTADKLIIQMVIDRMNDIRLILEYVVNVNAKAMTIMDRTILAYLDQYLFWKGDKIMGYHWDKIVYELMSNGTFRKSDVNIQKKYELERKLIRAKEVKNAKERPNYAEIHGFIDNASKFGDTKFYIVNKKIYKTVLTASSRKSLRSEITGRVCDSFKRDMLDDVVESIGMKFSSKSKKNSLCMIIEFLFRYKQHMDDRKIWFYNNIKH
jgi:hypothetical protein